MRALAAPLTALLAIGWVRAQELPFQRLTADEGLSDNTINCLFQDRAGFLWIGTERGIDRYDGQRADHVTGSDFPIAAISQDAQGALWAATKGHGLLKVDPGARSAERLHHAPGDPRSIASDQLTAVFDLNDTTLLLGSREHTLILMDKRTRAFTYWSDSTSIDPARAKAAPTGLTGWCHAITPLNKRWLWIGLLNKQTSFLVDRSTNRIVHHLILRRPGSETQTCALLQEGTLYTGGWQQGLDAARMEDAPLEGAPWFMKPNTIGTKDEVIALTAWRDGSILAGTRGHGLLMIDAGTHEILRIHHRRSDANTLPSDRIRCLLADRNGILWVGTANGLAFHAPQVWRMRAEPLFPADDDAQPELLFHGIAAEGASGFRAFTSNGFYTQAALGAAIKHHPIAWNGKELQPTTLLHEGQGALIGTEYGFVRQRALDASALEPVTVRDGFGFIYHPGDMYQVRGVSTDTMNGKPVLVVATLGFGVHVLDAATMTLLGSGMPPAAHTVKARSLVNDLLRDAMGVYWFASGDGLYRWSCREPLTNGFVQQPQTVDHAGVIAPGSAIARLTLVKNVLWAVTRDGRLLRVQGNRAVQRSAPWKVNAMHAICENADGRLWISTDDGLLRYDPREDGFLRVPVNDGHGFRKLTRAITRLNDGRIALAAGSCIITFDPADFDALPSIPSAYLSSATAGGHPVPVKEGHATLSYRSSVLDIGLSALAFGYPKPLTFRYRLDGVEDEWRTATAAEPIRYAGIPVGEHRLLVQVEDPYGRTGPEQALLTITVQGPFWQQWWFYALAALIASGAVFAWSRYRIAQALKLQAVRNRIASDLHDEVGSSLSSITIGSQLARQLSSAENEQVKALLARIGETSSESLRSISDIVWAIDPKNDEGEALVKRMRRIAQELLERKGTEVRFTVSGGVEELKLPMNARKELLLIFKEAAHNASKYAGARTVRIDLERANGTLTLRVADDGKGFDPALHPDGHGLGSMRRRAEALGSALELRSAPGQGTQMAIAVELTGIRD
jgi:signal transduction histidine kinase/ligand-binding sensor domain-containing protein